MPIMYDTEGKLTARMKQRLNLFICSNEELVMSMLREGFSKQDIQNFINICARSAINIAETKIIQGINASLAKEESQ